MGLLGDLGPAIRHAEVTEDQQQQIRAVMDSHRDEFKAIGERMKAARDAMRAVVEADTIDENAIRAKAADVAAVEADQAVLGAKVRAEILGLLTAGAARTRQAVPRGDAEASRARTSAATTRHLTAGWIGQVGRVGSPYLPSGAHRHSSPTVFPPCGPSIRARRSAPSFQ